MKSISSNIIVTEAKKMGFKIKIIDKRYDMFSITGNNQTYLFKNIDCGLNNSLGVRFSRQKKLTYALLEKKNIPVPSSIILTRKEFENTGIKTIRDKLLFPLVTKPAIGEHGDGVTVNIRSEEMLICGIETALKHNNNIIIQPFYKGEDYRIIVVNHKCIAAMKRVPAHIQGDGKSSIKILIQQENMNPMRGELHSKGLSIIPIDQETENSLTNQGLNRDSIPEKKQIIYVRKNANLSTGGLSIDVTDQIHPSIKKMAEKASKIIGLKVCGIDYISEDISKPLAEQSGGIIEINHTPGLRGHHFPAIGKPRNIAKAILKTRFSINGKGI